MIPPAKEKCPNVKVDELFRWCRHVWKEAWVLSKNFSVDEQTCKMQGKSEYKTRCGKFKRIGDGIQTDCIADDGYTYDFYFRNEPVDTKWIDKGMCPMHARLLHMFGNLREVGHQCKMDNLFNSVSLARAAYMLQTKVLIHGVIRKSGRGVPAVVIQEELGGKRADKVRGTVKVAVLKDDSESHDLIVASCYDQKPFYMITHSVLQVTWVEHVKKVYSYVLGKAVDFAFLRWNLSHEYNFEMNDNDVADQLRLVYRLQRLQRNQKWWWALWMWAWEVTMVNAYMMLRRYCDWKGIGMPWTHHNFNEAIGYAHVDPVGEWPKWTRKPPPELLGRKDHAKGSLGKRKRVTQQKRAPKVNMDALCAKKGRLKVRLNTSEQHIPIVPAHSKAICQLHRWAHNEKKCVEDKKKFAIPSGARSTVMQCKVCNVILCLRCYEIFHTCEDIGAKIDTICAFK